MANKIACLGDSITQCAPTRVNKPWPMTIQLAYGGGGNAIVANYGVGGETAAQCRTRWTSQIRNKGYTHLVIMAGTNNVAVGTPAVGAGATAFSSIQSTYQEALADGLKVVLCAIPPFKGYNADAQAQIECDSLNGLILAVSASGLAAIDTYTALESPADTLAAAYNSGDGLHPNQAGSDVIAAAVKAAIDSL